MPSGGDGWRNIACLQQSIIVGSAFVVVVLAQRHHLFCEPGHTKVELVRPFAPARSFDGGDHRRGESIETFGEAGPALGHYFAYFNGQTFEPFGSIFNLRHSFWLGFRQNAGERNPSNCPITLHRFQEAAHLFGEAGELVPIAVIGSEGVDQYHGERVERVGESGFALNQKFHDLIAHVVASNGSCTASLQGACKVHPLLDFGMHV